MQVELRIIYNTDTDNVAVGGPTDDPGLCHLLLDLARQSLFGASMQKAKQRRIIEPGLGPVPVPRQPS